MNEKEHQKRNGARLGFIQRRILTILGKLKRTGQGFESYDRPLDASGEGEGSSLADLAQGQSGSTGAEEQGIGGKVGRNLRWGLEKGDIGFTSMINTRRDKMDEALDMKTLEDNWSEIQRVYRTLLAAEQKKGTPDPEKVARENLKYTVRIELRLRLVSPDSVVARLYQQMEFEKGVRAGAPKSELNIPYQPDKMRSDDPFFAGEDIKVQRRAIEMLKQLAATGQMKVPDKDELLDLTVSTSKDMWINLLKSQFERSFVPKDVFNEYFPRVVALIGSAQTGASSPRTPDAVSPQGGRPTEPATQPRPRITTGVSPEIQRQRALIDMVANAIIRKEPSGPHEIKNNNELKRILAEPSKLLAAYPDDAKLTQRIKALQGISAKINEMYLPIGYPDLPNGKYSDRIRDDITRKGSQAWGAAGSRTGGLSPKEYPIMQRTKEDTGGEGDGLPIQKWTSLKEHLELTSLEKTKELLREKVEKKLRRKKYAKSI